MPWNIPEGECRRVNKVFFEKENLKQKKYIKGGSLAFAEALLEKKNIIIKVNKNV